MEIGDFIRNMQNIQDQSTNKMVIVDASDKDGKLLAAFLNSNFGREQVLVVSQGDAEQEGAP